MTLERAPTSVPEEIEGLVPFHAGETSRLEVHRLTAAPGAAAAAAANHRVIMLLQALIAFARTALETGPIGHAHVAASG